jgi:hypothetical protein
MSGFAGNRRRSMTNTTSNRRMILCTGMQSGGTTLVSWCFLQRRDTNGVLDMPSDVLRVAFEKVVEPLAWCKTTSTSFRWIDIAGVYGDLGWQPEPFLVARDVRATYASLSQKWYGFNGTTAEDPPLRLRFRRFLEDWRLFRHEGWPVLKYEDVVTRGSDALRDACDDLSLPWDEAMATWPKKSTDIAYADRLNESFQASMDGGSLKHATLREKADLPLNAIPPTELAWLEDQFAEYNEVHGYPAHASSAALRGVDPVAPIPRYEGTVRDWLYRELDRLETENYFLQQENERLKRGEAVAGQPGRR